MTQALESEIQAAKVFNSMTGRSVLSELRWAGVWCATFSENGAPICDADGYSQGKAEAGLCRKLEARGLTQAELIALGLPIG